MEGIGMHGFLIFVGLGVISYLICYFIQKHAAYSGIYESWMDPRKRGNKINGKREDYIDHFENNLEFKYSLWEKKFQDYKKVKGLYLNKNDKGINLSARIWEE